jgi:hypothetical protein
VTRRALCAAAAAGQARHQVAGAGLGRRGDGAVVLALLLAAVILAQPVPAVIAAFLAAVAGATLGLRQLRRRRTRR